MVANIKAANDFVRSGDIRRIGRNKDIVVFVAEREHDPRPGSPSNSWRCVVVGGTNETYPRGGHDISVLSAELHEGELIQL